MGQSVTFGEVVARPDAALDVGAALIAQHAHPGLKIEDIVVRLDALASRCPTPSLHGLCEFLFAGGAFTGNANDYYDPENSFIDSVLDRGVGLPITLSVLAIEVGRRLGHELVGVGLPGHFLVRDAADSKQLIDPFNGGRSLDEAGCERMLSEMQGRQVSLHPSWLAPMDNRAILWRMLSNLKAGYLRRNNRFDLVWVMRLRCAFPDAPESEFEELARANAMFN